MIKVKANSVCLVVVYLGDLPVWFSAFLISCGYNASINWLIYSDSCYDTSQLPSNVSLKRLDFSVFKQKCSEAIGVPVVFKNPKKICDLKPLFGEVLAEDLIGYEYWGHCDLDVIWGDLESFLEDIDYLQYDIVSTRKLTLCGHFTLYRNQPDINKLYKQVANFQKAFCKDKHYGFDEGAFSYYLFERSLQDNFNYKIFWPRKYAADWPELENNPLGWCWEEGKIKHKNAGERIYLHFMTWKRTLKYLDFSIANPPRKFKIIKYGMWEGRINLWYVFVNFLTYPILRKILARMKRIFFNKKPVFNKINEPIIRDRDKFIY